jgi:hypothetical protein
MSRGEDKSRQRAADPAGMEQDIAGCRGLRYELTDPALECRKSHWRIVAART